MRSLVMFHGGGPLRDGFGHCFLAVLSKEHWIRIDGSAGLPEVEAIAAKDYPLAEFYREQGYRVIEVNADRAPLSLAPRVPSCVGLVKAFLSIRAPFVQTPYQLHSYLKRRI